MAGQTIYPKRTPGVANVRKTPGVNSGVINNLLLAVSYGKPIGSLTGAIVWEVVAGKKYLWFGVATAKGPGWVREDVFSYQKTNAETQLPPAAERQRIAQAAVNAAVGKIKLVGNKLAKIGPLEARLKPSEAKAMQAVRAAYLRNLANLQATGVVKLTTDKPLAGLGLIWTIPLVLGVVSIIGTFGAYALEVIMKKLVDIKQVETDADLQLKVISSLENATLSSDPGTAKAAVDALEKTNTGIEDTKQSRAEIGGGDGIMDNLKQIATFAVVGFVGLELYKASRR